MKSYFILSFIAALLIIAKTWEAIQVLMDTWTDKQNVVYTYTQSLTLTRPHLYLLSFLYLQKHENMIHKWFHWHLILSLSKEKCCDCLKYQVQALCTLSCQCFRCLALLQWMQGLLLFMKTEMISVINTDFFTRHYWGRHVINRPHDSYSPWNYENSFQTLTITYSKKMHWWESLKIYSARIHVCVCLEYPFLGNLPDLADQVRSLHYSLLAFCFSPFQYLLKLE